MHGNGVGLGYETTGFHEPGEDGSRRIAAFVFWRGGGLRPDAEGRLDATGIGVEVHVPGALRLKPLRYALFAIALPLLWVANKIVAYRRRRSTRRFIFVPMSVAVQEARHWARYEPGVLQINARKFAVPADGTLVVFVEDDASQDDDVAITTHVIPTSVTLPGTIPIEFVRRAGHMMLAIHHDPVCREFVRRASQSA